MEKIVIHVRYRDKLKVIYTNSPHEIPPVGSYIAIRTNGTKVYYRDGRFHRNGAPAIIYRNGTVIYCQNGKYHRNDAPAYLGYDGKVMFFEDGLRHRVDGPAVLYPDGKAEFWKRGKHMYTYENWIKAINEEIKNQII